MRLDGIHHITAITGDAPRNLDFYVRVLGLRLVKKTVNQDDPTVYHLFYADDEGSPGADLTFFEYPGARAGRAGAGTVHRIAWRVGSEEAIVYWQERLRSEGVDCHRDDLSLRFLDPEGLDLELVVEDVPDAPLTASGSDVPADLALRGFAGARAFARDPQQSSGLLADVLGLRPRDDASWEARGATRGGWYEIDPPPPHAAVMGAGVVHHIAWATEVDEQEAWLDRLRQNGVQSTPIVERFYFRSIYFREPGGVLFELATKGPGFAVDEPADALGRRLSLPPRFEPLRPQIEGLLTPLPDVVTR